MKHTSARFSLLRRKGSLIFRRAISRPGEEPETCALREVSEESGIKGHKIVRPLLPSYHTYAWEGISYLKKTSWFLMEYSGKMMTEPQIKEGITKVEWLLPEEISKIKGTAWLSLMDLINESVFNPHLPYNL